MLEMLLSACAAVMLLLRVTDVLVYFIFMGLILFIFILVVRCNFASEIYCGLYYCTPWFRKLTKSTNLIF